MANHGDLSPQARERANRTILVADVFSDNADAIAGELPYLAEGFVLVAVVDAGHDFTGTHQVDRTELVERIPELEGEGGWAMVFSPGASADEIRRRTDEMASIARQRVTAIDRIVQRRRASAGD